MKRTERGTRINVTLINPADMTTTVRAHVYSMGAEKALEQCRKDCAKLLKDNAFNGLVPFKYDAEEVDGKTYDVLDLVFYAEGSAAITPDCDISKTFKVDSCIIDYVAVGHSKEEDKLVSISLPLPVGTTASELHDAKIVSDNLFIYRMRWDNSPYDIKKYMSFEKFKSLSK